MNAVVPALLAALAVVSWPSPPRPPGTRLPVTGLRRGRDARAGVDGVDASGASRQPATVHHVADALVLLSLAQLMVVLDSTIANIALPYIGADLDIDQANLSWIVTGYALTFGGFLLLGGRLAADAAERFLVTGKASALALARKRFMRLHGRVFLILRIMQGVWYRNDALRERFVSICRDKDVQQLTWDSYMNKELVRAKPVAHVRIFFKDLAHLFRWVSP